jgi:hypothetical protein
LKNEIDQLQQKVNAQDETKKMQKELNKLQKSYQAET